MQEVRNPDKRLVCNIDEKTGAVEILEKGWITKIIRNADGTIKITHCKAV
jgi:hypothetical protein